jgi:hypothetical protein
MFFLSDLSTYGRTIGAKDKKKRIRKRGALLISNELMPGYKPHQTTYIGNSENNNKILRVQYQHKDGEENNLAFLGKPRYLNVKERVQLLKQGFLKGDYKQDGTTY